jgi:signal peptidase I
VVVLGLAVAVAVVVRLAVAQMFFIPSASMAPTLAVGDRIVVDKLAFRLGDVHRGDIVVFSRPPGVAAHYADLVKRVVGLPGDTLRAVGGRLLLDGRPLAEPWLAHPVPPTWAGQVTAPYNLVRPYVVPAGHYFVLGDNRTDSEDSRFFGPVAGDALVGRMAFKMWPLDQAFGLVVLVALVLGALGCLLWALRLRESHVRAADGDDPGPGPSGP